MQRFARLAALGAWAAVAGLVAAFAGYVFVLTWPNGEGMDAIESWIAWISGGCVALALLAVHIVYARYLSGIASGQKYSIENNWRVGVDV